MGQRINYKYDGHDFNDLEIVVASSSGVIDMPEVKERQKTEWQNMNGHLIDSTSKAYYKERNIEIACNMIADSAADFVDKIQQLQTWLRHAGCRILSITLPGMPNKPLIFYVYPTGSVKVTKKWSAGTMTGSFTLQFVEPEPLKKVLTTAAGSETLSITLSKKGDVINIYWGDGGETLDITATTDNFVTSAQHSYAARTGESNIIIVTGDVETATITSETAEELWNIL